MKKEYLYFLILFLIFISFEIFVRSNENSVASMQDKMLLKKQMYLIRRPTEVLFLGSSRTQDSVEPTVLMPAIAKHNPKLKDINVFNGAATGANINRLKYFVDNVLDHKSLKLLVIEVSNPQMEDLPLGIQFAEEEKPKTLEDRLQKYLNDNLYIVKYRKLFRVDTILKAPLLMLANHSVGTEFFRRAILRDLMEDIHYEKINEALKNPQWNPHKVSPQEHLLNLKSEQLNAFNIYVDIAKSAKTKGVRVLFLVPPLRGKSVTEECDESHKKLYQALAFKTMSPVYSKACQDLDAVFFRDSSHLNKQGRTLWSEKLAKVVSDNLAFTLEEGQNAL